MTWALIAYAMPGAYRMSGNDHDIIATFPTQATCERALSKKLEKYDVWLCEYNAHMKAEGLVPIGPITGFRCVELPTKGSGGKK